MFKFAGILTGIALTTASIYGLAPEQAAEIQTQVQQSGLNVLSELFNNAAPTKNLPQDLSQHEMSDAIDSAVEYIATISATATQPAGISTEETASDEIRSLVTGQDSTSSDADTRASINTKPQNTLGELQTTLAEALKNEINPAPSGLTEAQTLLFWKPFENRQQAQAFINYLHHKTGFVYEVIVETHNNHQTYQAALSVPATADAAAMLHSIEQSTGIAVKNQSAG